MLTQQLNYQFRRDLLSNPNALVYFSRALRSCTQKERIFDAIIGANNNADECDSSFGIVEVNPIGRIVWMIQYWDRHLQQQSLHPDDPTRTRRVMEIMTEAEFNANPVAIEIQIDPALYHRLYQHVNAHPTLNVDQVVAIAIVSYLTYISKA